MPDRRSYHGQGTGQERYSCGMSGIVLVNELKIGIPYQCYRTRSQIVGCIQNPISSIELDKRVTHRVRWRRKRWQIIVEMLAHIERC